MANTTSSDLVVATGCVGSMMEAFEQYRDFGQAIDDTKPVKEGLEDCRRRQGQYDLFPCKLHYLLEQLEIEGNHGILEWRPHGRAFEICDEEAFATKVLPL